MGESQAENSLHELLLKAQAASEARVAEVEQRLGSQIQELSLQFKELTTSLQRASVQSQKKPPVITLYENTTTQCSTKTIPLQGLLQLWGEEWCLDTQSWIFQLMTRPKTP